MTGFKRAALARMLVLDGHERDDGARPGRARLERDIPSAGLYLAHLDRGQFIHRIVDARNGLEYGLRSNNAMPLGGAFDSHMPEARAARRPGNVGTDPTYAALPMQARVTARSYMGVPLELSDGTRVGS